MDTKEKYKKEDLYRLIFTEKKSYREIGRIYGVSDTYIKKVPRKFGFSLDTRKKFPDNFVPHNKKEPKKCHFCGELILHSTYSDHKYCSKKCSSESKKKNSYSVYLENQNDYCYNRDLKFIKPHIKEEQSGCCAICGINDEWNDKKLVFVLDHIDGNATNNLRENLRLVCPNCDSQLETYKSKNKNSARKERYLKNYKN